ncbi:MAG TPA: radical SAM protein [Thermoanaerobaculia bacterium]|nr:radical SAM protein [Thermoanaerobaculia bacterium]
MKLVLAHPPLDDPTIPYHSTAYLAGHLVKCGFEAVSIRDTNVELVNWCLEKDVTESFYAEAERRLQHFEGKDGLGFVEQEEYFGLWSNQTIGFDELARSVKRMRDPEAFLDFEDYKESVSVLLRYFGFLGSLSYPCEIAHFRQSTRGRYSPYHLRDLFDADLGARICQVFGRFLDERLAADREIGETDCLGISIVYDHQLFHALHMARWFKSRWPEKKVLLGGTAISQLYKYLKDPLQMKRFFTLCDGIVVGEGETAICQIADAGGEIPPGSKVQNLITYDAGRDRLYLPQHIHYEDVPALGRPLFRYPWDLYLSPARGINYSPTRGCYWNKCTFCDYGLNTAKPTSPWRERRIDQVVDDLRHASEESQAKYVYFAVDVMSPAYLDRLSDAIHDACLDLHWCAELRMERVFSTERCEKMAQSGCVCVSFGMESGNQRILDLIDKGTKVAYMGETMKNFSDAGIAVQLMSFSDFPTETQAEKAESHQFVKDHEAYWSAGGMGTFLLTGTAIVAKEPARFGIRLIETREMDIVRAITYEMIDQDAEDNRKAMLTEDRDASFESDGGVFPVVFNRPWAGGTDTLHTMIYYRTYGKRFFRENPVVNPASRGPESDDELLACRLFLPGLVRESPFDIRQIVGNRQRFADYLEELSHVPQEPTLKVYDEWCSLIAPVPKGAGKLGAWIRVEQKCVPLDRLVYRLLSLGMARNCSLSELLGGLQEELRVRLLGYLRELSEHGLIELKPPRLQGNAALGWIPSAGLANSSASLERGVTM